MAVCVAGEGGGGIRGPQGSGGSCTCRCRGEEGGGGVREVCVFMSAASFPGEPWQERGVGGRGGTVVFIGGRLGCGHPGALPSPQPTTLRCTLMPPPLPPRPPQAISKAAADLGDMDLSHLLLDTTELRKGLGASLDDKLIRDLQVGVEGEGEGEEARQEGVRHLAGRQAHQGPAGGRGVAVCGTKEGPSPVQNSRCGGGNRQPFADFPHLLTPLLGLPRPPLPDHSETDQRRQGQHCLRRTREGPLQAIPGRRSPFGRGCPAPTPTPPAAAAAGPPSGSKGSGGSPPARHCGRCCRRHWPAASGAG